MAVAVAVAVAVTGGGAVAVAVAVAGLTKRFFNHIQKDFLINVWGYCLTPVWRHVFGHDPGVRSVIPLPRRRRRRRRCLRRRRRSRTDRSRIEVPGGFWLCSAPGPSLGPRTHGNGPGVKNGTVRGQTPKGVLGPVLTRF